MKVSNLLLVTILFIASSCESSFNKADSEYSYVENLEDRQYEDHLYSINVEKSDKIIDIIMIIDNSGSMSTIQNNVIKNAEMFFEELAKKPFLNWRLGLLSTDQRKRDFSGEPIKVEYLGFDEDFSSTIPRKQALKAFQKAVASLGIRGSGTEVSFYNLKRTLDKYSGRASKLPKFRRANAHLITIMISDEPEQSQALKVDSRYGIPDTYNPNLYEPAAFYNYMKSTMAPEKILRFYSAISHPDLQDCPRSSLYWKVPWVESNYKKIVDISGGINISACTSDFGDDLSRIGEDIANIAGRTTIVLRRIPKKGSIRIYYKDRELFPGAEYEGGDWFYDGGSNSITFYNIDFVEDIENDTFQIDFEVNDAIDRQY